MQIAVLGLWHLGCVTAACLAAAGHEVTGIDPDGQVVEALRRGEPPVEEPGLAQRIREGLAAGRLHFTARAEAAVPRAELLWITFDTPVDEHDEADVPLVRRHVEAALDVARPGTIVLVSSQVPVGFTRHLAERSAGRGLSFACAPENLRLGRALESFDRQERVVIGVRDGAARPALTRLFEPFAARIEWMSIESAEMSKHALNAFLATSVAFINEVARICETVGADAKEVERALKSEPRIGPRAYLGPGGPFAGGTLARDVRFLMSLGAAARLGTPLCAGVVESNDLHARWTEAKVEALLAGIDQPVAAILGLAYTPGTNTLRRSSAVALCRSLAGRGVAIRAHDPAVRQLTEPIAPAAVLCADAAEALEGADVAVVGTAWPQYRELQPDDVVASMRRPRVVDQTWLLAGTLGADPRILYVAPGRGRVG